MFAELFQSPLGPIIIRADWEAVTVVSFLENVEDFVPCPNVITAKCASELSEYFEGKRKEFTVKVKTGGTEFQQKCFRQLCEIPYGETISYGEQAAKVGNPKAARAVGGANHNNPIAVIVPCHRVIGKNGKMVGYAGGMHIKEWLLEHEMRYK